MIISSMFDVCFQTESIVEFLISIQLRTTEIGSSKIAQSGLSRKSPWVQGARAKFRKQGGSIIAYVLFTFQVPPQCFLASVAPERG